MELAPAMNCISNFRNSDENPLNYLQYVRPDRPCAVGGIKICSLPRVDAAGYAWLACHVLTTKSNYMLNSKRWLFEKKRHVKIHVHKDMLQYVRSIVCAGCNFFTYLINCFLSKFETAALMFSQHNKNS
jgi:hypothetical protein